MIIFGLDISYRAYKVWWRNFLVYIRTWLTNLLAPILEPILYLFAFGFGLGAIVEKINYQGIEISYIKFFAPAIIAITTLNYSFFETTYASFVRMYYQKTFDSIISTPLSIEDVIMGEILWGATKSIMAGTIMLIVISFYGILTYPSALLIIPLSFFSGLLFGSLGLIFTSIVPRIDMFNIPVFLLFLPMYLFSGTFFPLENLPKWAQKIAYIFPLMHFTYLIRNCAMGIFNMQMLVSLLFLIILCLLFLYIAIVWMKKKLIK